jgi:cytochrome oxidase Cu insertion factor (SCO1/SenC/PrrC family)
VPDQEINSEEKQLQNKKNRKVILAICGIPIAIILFSTALYFLVETKTVDLGTVNNGQLIVPPLEFSALSLTTLSGEKFDYSKPDPKWAYIVFGDKRCINACESMLYIARQSIIALAKKMSRVRLIYVTTDGLIDETLQQRFDEEYRGLDIVSVKKSDIEKLFAESAIKPFKNNTFYVADPRGWLMMHYEIENTQQDTLNVLGKAVVRDMKRLIK